MAAVYALLLSEEVLRISRIERKTFRDRYDPMDLSDRKFIKLFRLPKYLVLEITEKLNSYLPPEGLPSLLRVLIALRFYASGSYQQSIANDLFLAVSQATVSNCISSISRGITEILMKAEIRFPDATEQNIIKRRVYENTGLPGVIGAIDCTHVAIVQPVDESPYIQSNSFVNRKGTYSINVQIIVDDLLIIRNINSKFPGSVHDSFIWKQSRARDFLKDQYESTSASAWILGDSGYPLEPWLITPYATSTVGSQEEVFNKRHSSFRSCVERCNGVLKSRFRCLLKHRVLHYQPTPASFIINACAVLHNLCIKTNVPIDVIEESFDSDDTSDSEAEDEVLRNMSGPQLLTKSKKMRNRIAQNLKKNC